MSPQFVDFDADGKLDIVAGIFDGSPHLVRGSAEGWLPPEQILDRDGARIVFNQFWNFDTKKWDSTNRCDGAGHSGEGHLTSAVAMDWDGDGDLDLLLGDHASGRVYRRTNEGTPLQAAFATKNEPVLAAGAPIDVPGTVATLRLVDWLCSAVSSTDFGDHDGDGDLDLVVGGYSHWTPKPVELTAEQSQRAAALQAELKALEAQSSAIMQTIDDATKGLDEDAADKKREELYAGKRDELTALGKKRQAAHQELDPLVPGPKRVSFVWLYENLGSGAKPPAAR